MSHLFLRFTRQISKIAVMLTAASCLSTMGFSQQVEKTDLYAPGSLIVKFRRGYDIQNVRTEKDLQTGTIITGIVDIDALNKIHQAQEIKPMFTALYNPEEDRRLGNDRMFVLQFPANTDVEDIARQYAASANVDFAHPNYLFKVTDTPNDVVFDDQWSLAAINAEEAWDYSHGSSDVLIGILDTGIDTDHIDLQANLISSAYWRDFVDIDTTSYKNSGWTLFSGEDYVTQDTLPEDFEGHGTMVASVASGATNNQHYLAHLGWNCKIIPVRAGFKATKPSQGTGGWLEDDDWANALNWLTNNTDVDIINMSFGAYGAVNGDQITAAANAGIILVAAAGNDNCTTIMHPAAFSSVLAVGASSQGGSSLDRWELDANRGSNYGTGLDIMAPGDGVWVCTNNGSVSGAAGTSIASPYLAGLAGLVLSRYPHLSKANVENILKYNAFKGMVNYSVYEYGAGRIDAGATMRNIIVPYHYSTVDSAVAAAASGQTVIILSGTHQALADVTVPSGVTLDVQPGATVYFNAHNVLIYGTLNADSCTFRGNSGTGNWSGILYYAGSGGTLNTVTIKYGTYGIALQTAANPTVTNCTIDACTYGIYGNYYGGSSINGNTVTNSTYYGIYIGGGEPTLSNNTVQSSGSVGVKVINDGTPILNRATLESSIYGVYADGGSPALQCSCRVRNNTFYQLMAFYHSTIDASNGHNDVVQYNGYAARAEQYSTINGTDVWWGECPPTASWFFTATSSTINYTPGADSSYFGKPAITEVMAMSPEDALLEQARNDRRSGLTSNAVTALKELVQKYPASPQVWEALRQLSDINSREGSIGFREYLTNLLTETKEPLRQATHSLYYGQLIRAGQYDQALMVMEQYRIDYPKKNGADNVLITMHSIAEMLLKDCSKADEYYRTMLSVMPEAPETKIATEMRKLAGKPIGLVDEIEQKTEELEKPTGKSLKTGITSQYPNPFNPSTTIQFGLKDAGQVKIRVYDVLGREVAVLVNEQLPAGMHETVWNGSAHSSGIYFVRMETAGFVQTRKIFMLK